VPSLPGRVAIVTGAAQGLGAAYARALAGAGTRVVVSDILPCDAVVDGIRSDGGEALAVTADVSDASTCAALADAALSAYGKVDVLVNNAALFATLERKPFEQITPTEWDRVMAVNVRGPFLCARAVVPAMKRAGYGKIVNVSSNTVFAGTPGMLHYVASKGAMVAFTRALARELGDAGIRVNAIAPGLTMSEGLVARREAIEPYAKMAQAARSLKRGQVPDDLLGALLFLASADSDFMTGQTLVVDGGTVMH
jgi:NAD(P)-dependent dehydrogenase (short-subunit alcohol dehydrogenase family)